MCVCELGGDARETWGVLRRREEVGKRAVGGARERENEAVERSVLRRSGRVGRLEGGGGRLVRWV